MKEGYKTTEFWVSVIVNVLAVAVSFGIITDDEASNFAAIAPQLVSGMIALAYILSRWSLKLQQK